jgi:hypothetical protein
MTFRFDRSLTPLEQAVKAFAGMEPAEMIPTYRARYEAVYGEPPVNLVYTSRLQMTGMFRCLLQVEELMKAPRGWGEVAA